MGVNVLGTIPLRRMINPAADRKFYLMRDDFVTDDPAPLDAPRKCDPGPGSWTVTDTANVFAVTGGYLDRPGRTSAADPKLLSEQLFARVPGVCAYYFAGLRGGLFSLDPLTFFTTSDTALQVRPGTGANLAVGSKTLDVDYRYFIIARSTGAFFVIKGGVEFPDYTLLYTSVIPTTRISPEMRPGLTASTLGRCYEARLCDLGARYYTDWCNDYGIAIQKYLGTVAQGQTFVHEADCVIEWTQATVPSGSTQSIFFRIQDATNYWRIDVGTTGILALVEVVAGVATTRATTGAGAVASGHRVVVTAAGAVISGYCNDTARWTYSSAVNFQTETDGLVSSLGGNGVISDLVSWPRVLSAVQSAGLDAVIA